MSEVELGRLTQAVEEHRIAMMRGFEDLFTALGSIGTSLDRLAQGATDGTRVPTCGFCGDFMQHDESSSTGWSCSRHPGLAGTAEAQEGDGEA